jgi:hypothetical protein
MSDDGLPMRTTGALHGANFGNGRPISQGQPGTEIVVDKLREEVATRFGTPQFESQIVGLIQSKHRQFIAKGLLNLKPGVDHWSYGTGARTVKIRVVAGVGHSSPRKAGWYVVCNNRGILEADQRATTGWGLLVSEGRANRILIPRFHNQFARFRGIVWFDAQDSSRLPWNTTKTDVDHAHPIWQKTLPHMTQMMRPVMRYLNDQDNDVDEFTRDGSALYRHVNAALKV